MKSREFRFLSTTQSFNSILSSQTAEEISRVGFQVEVTSAGEGRSWIYAMSEVAVKIGDGFTHVSNPPSSMISLSTTALVAGPATQLVSRMASGIADVGRDFVSALNESPEEADVALKDEADFDEKVSRVAASNSSLPTAAKTSAPNKPTSLADLLQAIQNLIANLSDDSEETVTIESLSGDEVQVTGDEPLASSIKQWTKLHPDWARDWNTQAGTSALSKDLESQKLSAKISSTTVTLEPI